MEFLYSNLPPLKTSNATFSKTFYSLMQNATKLDIAVGYITADSLAELQQTIAYNKQIETLNLIIGMHRWDKFTKLEYDATMNLNQYLNTEKRGDVRLVTPFRFHGKMYTYSDKQGAFAGIIGSNNLGSIVESRTRTYEASVLFNERDYANQMLKFIEELSLKSTDNISDCEITDFKKRNALLEDHENVEQISNVGDFISNLTGLKFNIPLIKNGAVPEKSNLNAFFGKGRLIAQKGIIQPRHWYEVELIVPKPITSLPGYPQKDTPNAVFDVVTDDGWKFSCNVNGDFSKNFRSKDDLKILGKWLKGRLENAGVLKVGELVTADTFRRYGRDSFSFEQTTKSNLWYLDFGV